MLMRRGRLQSYLSTSWLTCASIVSAEFRSVQLLTANISNTCPDSAGVTNSSFCVHQIHTSSISCTLKRVCIFLVHVYWVQLSVVYLQLRSSLLMQFEQTGLGLHGYICEQSDQVTCSLRTVRHYLWVLQRSELAAVVQLYSPCMRTP